MTDDDRFGCTLYWRGNVEQFANDIRAVVQVRDWVLLARALINPYQEPTVFWRGSVSDFVTDLLDCLSGFERLQVAAELVARSTSSAYIPSPMPEPGPLPMLLWCPKCGARHLDEGEFATRPHHTHACQQCGLPWRPALVPTVGVQFLPGFKNVSEVL